MPAYGILDLDPRKEPATVAESVVSTMRPMLRFGSTTGHIRIDSARDLELAIFAAFYNAIGKATDEELEIILAMIKGAVNRAEAEVEAPVWAAE